MATPRPLVGIRALVVEDETLIFLMIEDMLNELGCGSVTGASTVEEAMLGVEGQTFDIATVDINLNGRSGFGVAAALAAQNVPFLFCTGNRTQDIPDEYRDRPVLRKPFRDDDLEKMVAALLPAGKPPGGREFNGGGRRRT